MFPKDAKINFKAINKNTAKQFSDKYYAYFWKDRNTFTREERKTEIYPVPRLSTLINNMVDPRVNDSGRYTVDLKNRSYNQLNEELIQMRQHLENQIKEYHAKASKLDQEQKQTIEDTSSPINNDSSITQNDTKANGGNE